MTAKEILENYPKAANEASRYFYEKLVNSLVDADVSEEYKEFIKSQEMGNEFMTNVIDTNPRAFFDVFDSHDIFIQTHIKWEGDDATFGWTIERAGIDTIGSSNNYPYRDIAERFAIEKAFDYLNNQL